MSAQKTVAVIVVAAGTGERMGGIPKQYRLLAGRQVLARTIAAFTSRDDVGWVLPVIHRDHIELYREADHGFFCHERDSYEADAAADAWQKLTAFFAQHLQRIG